MQSASPRRHQLAERPTRNVTALLRWPIVAGVRLARMTGSSSAPAGYRFPGEVIAVAVRWCLRYGLSYRDVEELLAERGVEVDHVTVYRWVPTFSRSSSMLPDSRATRVAVGGLWTRPT